MAAPLHSCRKAFIARWDKLSGCTQSSGVMEGDQLFESENLSATSGEAVREAQLEKFEPRSYAEITKEYRLYTFHQEELHRVLCSSWFFYLSFRLHRHSFQIEKKKIHMRTAKVICEVSSLQPVPRTNQTNTFFCFLSHSASCARLENAA